MPTHSVIPPTDLRCEYLIDPLGIDKTHPRLSWIDPPTPDARGQYQTAYQVLVASSAEALGADDGDLWDSGKVASDRNVNVAYEGKTLAGGQACWWKVRWWDGDDASEYSYTATFEMGLLEQKDWQGEWIAADAGVSSPLLRKTLHLEGKPGRARIYVCGLGYYELYVNGEKVGDSVLDPGTTYYHNDQPFPLNARVLYVTYDVTDRLVEGENVICVTLGNGWYSAEADIPPSPMHREPYGDWPVLMLQANIELASGNAVQTASDESWQWSGGPILYNDYSNGETYDARMEQPGWLAVGFDDEGWRAATVVDGPNGSLTAQMIEPIRVVETIAPIRISKSGPGKCVVDFGQHFSGWIRMRVIGAEGCRVTIRHGAELFEHGELDARSNLYNLHCTHIARQTDHYILKGEGEEVWEPRFTLHGFRYAEVIGYPGELALGDIEARHVRSSVESVGMFECDSELLNQIHSNVRWTFSSSMQGFPQDAADRSERVGWLGDPIPEDFFFNFDTAAFWSKWAMDIRDAQKTDGDLPVICPLHWRRTHETYGNMPVWKSTYAVIVWSVYRFYDDERILAEHYEGIRKLVDFLGSQAEGHIIERGLGDHMEPQPDGRPSSRPKNTPSALTSTAYYFYDVRVLAQAAEVLGEADDARAYGSLAEEIKAAFNARFLDATNRKYATGSQSSNAIPLMFGLVPEKCVEGVVQNLVADIEAHEGHLTTGMLGTNALVEVLPRHGAGEVMHRIATQTTYPSWGYAIKRGATTLWESWDGSEETQLSRNMKLFGSVGKFFYKEIAGIQTETVGFRRITLRPRCFGEIRWAKASVETVRGRMSVAWKRTSETFALEVRVPVGVVVDVYLPKMGGEAVCVLESGCLISEGQENGSVDSSTKTTDPDVSGKWQYKDDDVHPRAVISSGFYSFNLSRLQ